MIASDMIDLMGQHPGEILGVHFPYGGKVTAFSRKPSDTDPTRQFYSMRW